MCQQQCSGLQFFIGEGCHNQSKTNERLLASKARITFKINNLLLSIDFTAIPTKWQIIPTPTLLEQMELLGAHHCILMSCPTIAKRAESKKVFPFLLAEI